jgi:hypothetical protein
VDRAALEVARALSIPYGGWCPRGGWAEDFPDPPGVLARYPLLLETPLADPAQRTQWNIRDSDAVLIIMPAAAAAVSKGTDLARQCAERAGKPLLAVALDDPAAAGRTTAWLEGFAAARDARNPLALGIGGPRESEAPGICQRAVEFLRQALRPAAI